MLLGHPDNLPLRLLFFVPALLVAYVGHELGHAFAAAVQGDAAGRRSQRLTLDPRKLIDPLGFVLGLIVGFGYPRELRLKSLPSERARIGVALAGPIANLILAVLASLVLKLLVTAHGITGGILPTLGALCSVSDGPAEALRTFLATLYTVNLLVMGFNLLPLIPLDGFEFVRWLLKSRDPKLLFNLETNRQLATVVLVAVAVVVRPALMFLILLTASPAAAFLGVPLVYPCK